MEEKGTDSGLPLMKYPPLVLFVDEVHLLGKKADLFLNFFEPKERRAVTKQAVCDFSDATILAATTDKGRLPSPFLTRFRMVELESYSLEELGRIVALAFKSENLEDSTLFYEKLARIGRLNPRESIEKAKEYEELHQFNPGKYPLTPEGLSSAQKNMWQMHDSGLTKHDLQYLQAIEDSPKGIGSLTSLLPCGAEEIETVIEPFLIRLGAIDLTSKGRQITEFGKKILADIK